MNNLQPERNIESPASRTTHATSSTCKAALLFLILALCAVPILAQNFKATVVGRVTDANDATVPGASVTIVNTETALEQSVTAGDDGAFTIAQLPPGTYEVRVEATNFKRSVQTGLVLETDQTQRINVTLEAGNVDETITVVAEAPVINSDTSEKGEVITNRHYDLLYHDLTEAERTKYRNKIIKQGNLLADFYKPKNGRTYSYSQNHVFIPMAGLSVAAYAIYDESADAPKWAALSRGIYDRVLATYSKDGYYYEGFEYWVFSMPWMVHFLDAHAHATGEDLWNEPGLRDMHKYVAHSMLPDGQYVFDFGDIFEGNMTRAKKGGEYYRSHPGGRFHTNFNVLYRIASRFKNGEAQGVAEWMKASNHVNFEDYMSLLWYDAGVKAVPIEKQATSIYFKDHDVVFWRDNWTKDATAFAFKAGPPEGHHTAAQIKTFPDWHLSAGHAHPDAGSFIIYARGKYLTGDSGYAGVPMTAHHNTMLIDGRGQAREGRGHDAFAGVPYDLMDKIRITRAELNGNSATVRADLAAAYDPSLGVTKFEREFTFDGKGEFTVKDDIETKQPRVFTTLLHADERITQAGERRFVISEPNVQLVTQIIAPEKIKTNIEPNILTAPGQPGSVDKGERQVRGERLAISTVAPATSAQFVKTMRIESGAVSRQQIRRR